LRIEQRLAVTEVDYRVGNKKRNERHREFVFPWKVGRAADGNCRQRRKIRKPGRTGMNQEASRNAIRRSRKHEQESGNH